jgi:hypothetical protein
MQQMPFPPQAPQLPPDPQLGHVVAEWRAGLGRRVWMSIVVLISGGLIVLACFANDNAVLGGIFAVLTLFFVSLICVQQAAVKVTTFTNGIERRGLFGRKRLAWDQLQSYTLNVVDPAQTSAGAGVLVMLLVRAFTSKSQKPTTVVLNGRDGSKVTIPNYLKGFDSLIDSLLPYLVERLLSAAQYDLNRGVPVSFGGRLVFDPGGNLTYTGLFKKQYVLPFANIASIQLERALVVITQRDTGKSWQRIHVRTVPNLGVLQRLIAR